MKGLYLFSVFLLYKIYENNEDGLNLYILSIQEWINVLFDLRVKMRLIETKPSVKHCY